MWNVDQHIFTAGGGDQWAERRWEGCRDPGTPKAERASSFCCHGHDKVGLDASILCCKDVEIQGKAIQWGGWSGLSVCREGDIWGMDSGRQDVWVLKCLWRIQRRAPESDLCGVWEGTGLHTQVIQDELCHWSIACSQIRCARCSQGPETASRLRHHLHCKLLTSIAWFDWNAESVYWGWIGLEIDFTENRDKGVGSLKIISNHLSLCNDRRIWLFVYGLQRRNSRVWRSSTTVILQVFSKFQILDFCFCSCDEQGRRNG